MDEWSNQSKWGDLGFEAVAKKSGLIEFTEVQVLCFVIMLHAFEDGHMNLIHSPVIVSLPSNRFYVSWQAQNRPTV